MGKTADGAKPKRSSKVKKEKKEKKRSKKEKKERKRAASPSTAKVMCMVPFPVVWQWGVSRVGSESSAAFLLAFPVLHVNPVGDDAVYCQSKASDGSQVMLLAPSPSRPHFKPFVVLQNCVDHQETIFSISGFKVVKPFRDYLKSLISLSRRTI